MDFTTTPCAACGNVSEINENMIGCDGCEKWFHWRCVNATDSDAKADEWFCPATGCQTKAVEYRQLKKELLKKNKNGKKTAEDDTSDGEKSDSSMSGALEDALKALEKEQKAKEREMEIERKVREKRLQMERTLKEKRMLMETEMLQKEIELEQEIMTKALEEKKAHLAKIRNMRKKFNDQMEKVRQEIVGCKEAKQDGTRKKGNVPTKSTELAIVPKRSSRNTLQDQSSSSFSGKGALSSTKVPPVETEVENMNEEEDDLDDEEETDSVVEVEEEDKDEDEEDDDKKDGDEKDGEDNEEDDQEKDDKEDEEDTQEGEENKPGKKPAGKKKPATAVQHGLGPTAAQLAARNGITRKLPIFSGKPEEWPLFIGSYNASNEACGFSDVENLVRLQESLRGPALESVRSNLLLPKSVTKVIIKLRQLFGRPEQLLQHHLDKIKKLDPPKSDKLATFIPYGNAIEQLCDHLEAADLDQHLINPLLIQELVDKLPANDKREWVRYKQKEKQVTLRTFTDFVSKIVAEACEANVNMEFRTAPAPFRGKREKGGLHNHSTPSNSTADAKPGSKEPQKQKPCRVCNRTDHRLRFCQDFRNLPVTERVNVVNRWKLCKVCLNDHGKSECKFKIRCSVEGCLERHNPLLHQTDGTVAINTHMSSTDKILFRMIPVYLHFGERFVETLAFLDEGASVTLVEKSLVDRLGVQGKKNPLTIKWTADIKRVEKDSRQMNLWISARGAEKILLKRVQTVQELMLPNQSLNAPELANSHKFLQGLPVVSYHNERPGILIGLNNVHAIAPIEARAGNAEEPIAVRSQLGWTIYGPTRNTLAAQDEFLGCHYEITNQELHEVLKSHYAVEESVIAVMKDSKEDRRAREILEASTVRVGDRFATGLLWKTDDPKFPDNFPMALRRLKQLEHRLEKQPQLYDNVRRQINEYQQKGYAHRATADELARAEPGKIWYLPINVVLNPKKPNKVRLVWDAAASLNGVSLNSQLLTGPDMLTALPAVINRFRERPVAFGGDIREMYHQLQIKEADKSVQRFLFRNSSREEPDVYVMDVATFGSRCSPCQAQYVKNRNAMEFAVQYPDAASAIVEKHYVDDYFDSTDTAAEAIKRAKEVKHIHSKGGFEIRNWVSNSSDVLRSLGGSDANQSVHFNQDKETGTERVLGIIWNPTTDEFSFSTEHRADLLTYLRGGERPTKRVVLSCVMGFFDPLGLLATFTIHGRILIQNLWRTGCDWDDRIDDGSFLEWKRWIGCLPDVEAARIPRAYFGDWKSADITSLELHIFNDAGAQAYGSVAYFRTVLGGEVRCSLVMARAKVAPLKRQSIPRLELMGAVLGARMMQSILANHTLPIRKCYLWTDSQTVLSWLRSDQHNYKQFVAFRIGEIQELTNLADWRKIPSKFNIADELTKWGTGPNLKADGSWFAGPRFLYQPEQFWPAEALPDVGVAEEIRPCVLFHDTTVAESVPQVQAVSKWTRLVRIVASAVRFIGNCRRKALRQPILGSKATEAQRKLIKADLKVLQRPLLQEEMKQAEKYLWKQAQLECYADELRTLKKNGSRGPGRQLARIEKSSPLYKLTPFLDEDGVMRMGGRMQNSPSATFDEKFPIILPRKHEVTKKMLQFYHEKFSHGNRETVFNEVRQKFMILQLRAAILQVMKECVWCKVHRCQPTIPPMAPLPVQRITPGLRPFSAVGLDYLGPFEVSVGRRREKRWVCLFTCLAVRAIHLEVVHRLTTQSCLMAIQRFVNQRGVPEEFFSDNGTNFKGAFRVLQQVVDQINNDCAENNATIKWHFNPPATPHMGGVWERLVRSVKETLGVLCEGKVLTDEILGTALKEAEDIINSRPLTYAPQDSEEISALTPNHFLRGTVRFADTAFQEHVCLAEALRDAYKRSQLIAAELWTRWCKEYLPTINRRTRWYEEQKPLEKGDLVFVVDGKNRKCWIRGIVEKVYTGSDGRVRQAEVRTTRGVFRRGVANLAVLEIQDGTSGTSDGRKIPEIRAGDVSTPLG